MSQWSIDRARAAYRVARWSEGYFEIDADGDMAVCVEGDGQPTAKLTALCRDSERLGLDLPLLMRFERILEQRAHSLSAAFAHARQQAGYEGDYTPVYPIKVNQQRDVVDALVNTEDAGVGLEAGSKPELLAVLAMAPPGRLVICNGYKDAEFIRLALMGQQLGLKVIIVVEKPGELPLILRESRELGIEAQIGVRLRLTSIGGGNWQNSGGRRAKFGLVASQLIDLIETLKSEGQLANLKLLHFHMGSQIAQIADIRRGLEEAIRYYVLMAGEGADLRYLDVGGGIGVDYEGSASRNYFSINYRLKEYAETVVQQVAGQCDAAGLERPHLITEAGRAMTAHHAVLITDVLESEPMPGREEPCGSTKDPQLVELSELTAAHADLDPGECLHRADEIMDQIQSRFVAGECGLEDRADADERFYHLLRIVRRNLREDSRAHRRLIDELDHRLADKYFCNFSIFQSLPDVWGLRQVFPIVPISGLDRAPEARAVIEDLTCDSDGRIDRFVDEAGVDSALAVHALEPGQAYRLGVFLVGAYQETLGDIHNLFGDTDVVNVRFMNGQAELTRCHGNDSAADMLRMVGYQPKNLVESVKKVATKRGLTASHIEQITEAVTRGLARGTYLKKDHE